MQFLKRHLGRKQRRNRAAVIARVQWTLGALITIAVALFYFAGVMERVEYPFQDLRHALFPIRDQPEDLSDEIVLIAVDDKSIDDVGYPVDRAQMAAVIEELADAGASVIALDIMFDLPGEDPEEAAADAALTRAFAHAGNVVAAVSFPWASAADLSVQQMVDEDQSPKVPFEHVFSVVLEQPDATLAEVKQRLPVATYPKRLSDELLYDWGDTIKDLSMKLEVCRTMIAVRERSSGPAIADGRPWPASTAPNPPIPPLMAAAARLGCVTFSSYSLDGDVRTVPVWVKHRDRLYPNLGLAAAALHLKVGVEAMRIEGDQTVLELPGGREVRLWMTQRPLQRHGQRCALNYIAWPKSANKFPYFKRDPDSLFPRQNLRGWPEQFAPIDEEFVNVASREDGGMPGSAAGSPELGERRGKDSEARPRHMVTLGSVLNPLISMRRVRENLAAVDQAMRDLHSGDPPLFQIGEEPEYERTAYAQRAARLAVLKPDDAEWQALYQEQKRVWEAVLAEIAAWCPDGMDPSPPEPGADAAAIEEFNRIKATCTIVRNLPRAMKAVDQAASATSGDIVKARKELARTVRGKICFIGWTATGVDADFITTAVDTKTPGVLVHIAVANSVLTGHSLRFPPKWLDMLAILVLGLMATWVGVRFQVLLGPFAVLGLVLALILFSGLWFWVREDMIIATGSPFMAASFAWIGVILHRLLVEERGRKRTEARFRSYVSPDVVDILVNNPELNTMVPQKRELTIMFSDIAGFTTLSEKLGTEGIGRILAKYLGAMTEILQKNKATLDKYLGDGIMAFWGAPIEDPDHARHAAIATIQMLDTLDRMNAAGEFEGAGALHVRIGLATGEVNVGDFGNPPHNSAYTVIGDTVNLAARLESANKRFGSQILMTQRVRDLMGFDLDARPIGRVVVKGKSEFETLYELIGPRRPKGDRTGEWILLTEKAVTAYIGGNLDLAAELFAKLEAEFGEKELAELYRQSIAHLRQEWGGGGPPPDFQGTIVLTEK